MESNIWIGLSLGKHGQILFNPTSNKVIGLIQEKWVQMTNMLEEEEFIKISINPQNKDLIINWDLMPS